MIDSGVVGLKILEYLREIDGLIDRVGAVFCEAEVMKTNDRACLYIENRRTGAPTERVALMAEIRQPLPYASNLRAIHLAIYDRYLFGFAAWVLNHDKAEVIGEQLIGLK